MKPLVSVVVPTFNRRAGVERLLRALATQTYPADLFEAVVVDDGSNDGTSELLDSLSLPFTLRIFRQPNQGPAAARNLGVRHASGRLIVFLDDDVAPVPSLITEYVSAHEVTPGQVVIGPMSPPGDWPRPVWIRWEERMLQLQYAAMLTGKYPCTPRQFYTGNASLERERFLDAGGFDPAFKRAEDVELAYRLRDRGATFAFNPWADVLHYASRTFASWCRTPYQYGRYDVAMGREKGHEALSCALHEFHGRHPLNRVLARLCVGRRVLIDGAVLVLQGVAQAADWIGAPGVAGLGLSGIFNLLYWQGVSDELGGPAPVWRAIAATAAG